MAVYTVATPTVSINAIAMTAYVKDVSLTYEADELDSTTAGGAGSKTAIAGLKSWKVEMTLLQDFANNTVDSYLFALVGAAAFPVLVRPSSAAKGVDNPEYSGNCILTSYPPMSGGVGELASVKITLRGTGALSRLTA